LFALFLGLTSRRSVVDRPVAKREEYFDIVIPKGFRIVKTQPVEDFDFYIVKKGEVPYV
jgi:hypothetical protein